MADNSLNKIFIQSYKDKKMQEKLTGFTVPINPETYSENLKVNLETKKGHGQQGTDPRYTSTEPEQFRIEIILDGTKTMEGYDKSHDGKTVKQQLDEFRNCVYYMDEEMHRPRFLKIFWSKEFIFPCVVSQLDINYNLFYPDGSPLRVKITATFLKYVNEENKKRSPDLTRMRIVNSSNRLDLMTYKIYNDSKYYLQVAKTNGLSSVRKLQNGKELFFAPFNKNEA